jgi:hypothetical protein
LGDLTVHKVKSWPHLFSAALSGEKTHDLRKSFDRDYRVDDILHLQKYDPQSGYSGRELPMRITYITSANMPCALSDNGLSTGYCILSITSAIL